MVRRIVQKFPQAIVAEGMKTWPKSWVTVRLFAQNAFDINGLTVRRHHMYFPQATRLLVTNEIHLLGDERGPMLEVIVSQTNFFASHTHCPWMVTMNKPAFGAIKTRLAAKPMQNSSLSPRDARHD